MKKKIIAILVVAVLLACAVFGIVGANDSEKVTVIFNGEEVVFDEETPPVWKNHYLMVEMKTIMDKLWSSARVQSTGIIQCARDMDKMSLMLDSDVANIMNQIVKMEVAPFRIDGTDVVMVPLKYVVEGYGGTYAYDEGANTVTVTIADATMKPMKFFDYMIMPVDDKAIEGVEGITVSSEGWQADQGVHKDHAIDGDFATRWSAPNQGSVDDPDAPLTQWMMFDLGQVVPVSGVGVAWFYGNGRNYPFSVEVSEDGNSWTEVIARRDSMKTDGLETFGWDNLDVVNARYVKVVGYGNPVNNWTHITEMRVFCPAGTTGAVEVDLK